MVLLRLPSDYRCTWGGQETIPRAASAEGSPKFGSVPFLLRWMLNWNKQLLSMHRDATPLNIFPLYDHTGLFKKQ